MEEQLTQESLNIMLQDGETKDRLKENLDGVIENVQATCVSEQIKAKNGSGEPSSGVIEYKRFVNSKIEDKGEARKRQSGNSINAKPVKVVISDDKEIVEELQGKDIRLYGIADLAERRTTNHSSTIKTFLDREFFKEVKAGTKVLVTGSTAKEKVDELLLNARNLQNDFIDGIDSELLVIVVNSKYRKELKDDLDDLPNGTDPRTASIGNYDSVPVYETIRLPEGVGAVVMINGAIAQPYYVSEYGLEKIPFDDAAALEHYLYKGTKALMEDAIFYCEDENKTVIEDTENDGTGN